MNQKLMNRKYSFLWVFVLTSVIGIAAVSFFGYGVKTHELNKEYEELSLQYEEQIIENDKLARSNGEENDAEHYIDAARNGSGMGFPGERIYQDFQFSE